MTDEERIVAANITDFPITELPPPSGPKVTPELIDSVAKNGIVQPILLGYRDGAAFRVIDGNRRLMAALELGMAYVPVLFVQMDTDELADELTLLSNQMRSPNIYEETRALEGLLEAGMQERDVQDMTGMGEAAMGQRLRIVRSHPKLRQWFMERKISLTTMEAAAKLDRLGQDTLVFRFSGKKKITKRDVDEIAKERKVYEEKVTEVLGPEERYKVGLGTIEVATRQLIGWSVEARIPIAQVAIDVKGAINRARKSMGFTEEEQDG